MAAVADAAKNKNRIDICRRMLILISHGFIMATVVASTTKISCDRRMVTHTGRAYDDDNWLILRH